MKHLILILSLFFPVNLIGQEVLNIDGPSGNLIYITNGLLFERNIFQEEVNIHENYCDCPADCKMSSIRKKFFIDSLVLSEGQVYSLFFKRGDVIEDSVYYVHKFKRTRADSCIDSVFFYIKTKIPYKYKRKFFLSDDSEIVKKIVTEIRIKSLKRRKPLFKEAFIEIIPW